MQIILKIKISTILLLLVFIIIIYICANYLGMYNIARAICLIIIDTLDSTYLLFT